MGQSNDITLSVRNLRKTIGRREIIRGVEFDVRRGEVFGFLGPNGSGKTTTIRMLVGLIKPSSGSILIAGHDVQKDMVKALSEVGCIVENPEMYPYLTGMENLEHFARMLPNISAARIQACVDRVGLTNRIYDLVKTYSLGMKQRLGIAQALLSQPSLMILDEPTNGLDPQGIRDLRDFIHQLASEGMSVFISSHLLSEVQLMCTTVAILNHGIVIKTGTVNELVKEAESYVVWTLQNVNAAKNLLISLDIPNAPSAKVDDTLRTLAIQMTDETIPTVVKRFVEAGIEIIGIRRNAATLEDLFLELTEGDSID